MKFNLNIIVIQLVCGTIYAAQLFRALEQDFFAQLPLVQISATNNEFESEDMNCSSLSSSDDLIYQCESGELVVQQGSSVGFQFEIDMAAKEYEFQINVISGVFNGLYVRSSIDAFGGFQEFVGAASGEKNYALVLDGLHGKYEAATAPLTDNATVIFTLQIYQSERESSFAEKTMVSRVAGGCCGHPFNQCSTMKPTVDVCQRITPNSPVPCTRTGKILDLTLDVTGIDKSCDLGNHLKELSELRSLTLTGQFQTSQHIWTRLFGADEGNQLLSRLRALTIIQDHQSPYRTKNHIDERLCFTNLEKLIIEGVQFDSSFDLPQNCLQNMKKLQIFVFKQTQISIDPFSQILNNRLLWYVELSKIQFVPTNLTTNATNQINSNSNLDLNSSVLENLKWLNLSQNSFENCELFNVEYFPNLLMLDASLNSMTGNLGKFVRYEFVQEMYLQGNRLTGFVPNQFSQLFQLQKLHLENNQLSGVLDLGIFADSLNFLNASFNEFSELIRSGNSSTLQNQLQLLDVSYNRLENNSFGSELLTPQLIALNLSNNQISDPVSNFFENLNRNLNNNLTDLRVNQNQMTGDLPGWLVQNLKAVQTGVGKVDFSNNRIEQISNFPQLLRTLVAKNPVVSLNISGNQILCPKMSREYLSYGISQIKCLEDRGVQQLEDSLPRIFAKQYGKQLLCEDYDQSDLYKEIVLGVQRSCGGLQQGNGNTDYYFIEVEEGLKEYYELVLMQNTHLQVEMQIVYLGEKENQTGIKGNYSLTIQNPTAPSQQVILRLNNILKERPGWWVILVTPTTLNSIQEYQLIIQLESNPRVDRSDDPHFIGATLDPPVQNLQTSYSQNQSYQSNIGNYQIMPPTDQQASVDENGQHDGGKKGGLGWGVATVVAVVCVPLVVVLFAWHVLHLYFARRRRAIGGDVENGASSAELQMELVQMMNRVLGQRIIEQLSTQTGEDLQRDDGNWAYTDCPICIEELQESQEQMQLPCGHRFHASCISNWIYRRGLDADCPICKGVIYETLSIARLNLHPSLEHPQSQFIVVPADDEQSEQSSEQS